MTMTEWIENMMIWGKGDALFFAFFSCLVAGE